MTFEDSRGYKRTNYVIDGGFEGFSPCSGYCSTEAYENWFTTSDPGGTRDATILHYPGQAYRGNSYVLFGSLGYTDNLSGTVTSAHRLQTIPGKAYVVSLFHNSGYWDQIQEANSFFEIIWNGVSVRQFYPGWAWWTHYTVTVVAQGNDELSVRGSRAPAWSVMDEVYVFSTS